MLLTSDFCRAQEAAQLGRAADSPLANVRIIAERAAKAWAEEAGFAEKREARHARLQAAAKAEQAATAEATNFSENPDRGLAKI
jgi:hypothetical protein